MRRVNWAIPIAVAIAVGSLETASAGFQRVHDASIVGNGNSTNDGHNLTRDLKTGLDWLDVNLTTDLSFNEVTNQFGVGGTFEGFRHATVAEVTEFWDGFGIGQGRTEQSAVMDPLLTAWGWTNSGSMGGKKAGEHPYREVEGFVADFDPVRAYTSLLVSIENQTDSANVSYNSHYRNLRSHNVANILVRESSYLSSSPVPEPTSLVMWGLGAFGLVASCRRRNRMTPAF